MGGNPSNTTAPDFPLLVDLQTKQLFLIKIETIHCFIDFDTIVNLFFKTTSRVAWPKTTHQLSQCLPITATSTMRITSLPKIAYFMAVKLALKTMILLIFPNNFHRRTIT